MPKYIFVTGGVVSGLGKGITAASIGLLLKSSGLSVDVVKFDPYLNIDPGTMSPYEHGEVYVLEDGSETDLDLGHYERFLDVNLTGISSVTSGKIYARILDQEREGAYLGKNVQLIPHVTNSIKECFARGVESDIRIIEIGGSTGDYEGDIFLESLRQFRQEFNGNVFHIHLGYVPFLQCSGEYKTKPLQVSIRELSRAGLQPDAIVARYTPEDTAASLSQDILRKLSLFGNLPPERVIALPDFDTIYEVPLYLSQSTIKTVLEEYTGRDIRGEIPAFFGKMKLLQSFPNPIKIGLVAKYTRLSDAYLSVIESLKLAGAELGVMIEPVLIDSEELLLSTENQSWQKLYEVNGIIVPGGFGNRGMEGKIAAVKYAREHNIPYLGICLGLQMAVVEFARNACGLTEAVSSEMFDSREELTGKQVVIDMMPEQFKIDQKGGTMRLGKYECWLQPNTIVGQLFGKERTWERHRHRLEVQGVYIPDLEKSGLVISGKHYHQPEPGTAQPLDDYEQPYLVEMIELPKDKHPYFVATQSHPEFLGRPGKPHPLFYGLVKACLK